VSEPQARILLVGDDAAVLNVIRILLRSEGYQVTTVLSTANALRQAAADPRIDLLVTAYLLGTETGIQVIAALRELLGRPLKAVLIRGETLSALAELPADPLVRLANKPVNAEQLLSLVAELLDHAPDSSGGWSVEPQSP
jgi:CheY-like chemotaxis protein